MADKRVEVRFTRDEYAALRAAAEAEGVSVADCIRLRALGADADGDDLTAVAMLRRAALLTVRAIKELDPVETGSNSRRPPHSTLSPLSSVGDGS